MVLSAHGVPRWPYYGAWVSARGHWGASEKWGAQEGKSLTANEWKSRFSEHHIKSYPNLLSFKGIS